MINEIRGEAELHMGGCTYVMAATMDGIAEFSRTSGCRSMQDLYDKFRLGEIDALRTAIHSWVQRGTDTKGKEMKRREAVTSAWGNFHMGAAADVAVACAKILNALTRPADGGEPDEQGNS